MNLPSQIVPAVVVVVANLMSGKNASVRSETVTAIFGLTAAGSIVAIFFVGAFTHSPVLVDYLMQLAGFCLLTALSRDYERILRPLFPWNR